MEDLRLGVTVVTKRIHIGRVKKNGWEWKEGHYDFTSEVLKVMCEYLEIQGNEKEITVNGKPKFIMTLKEIKEGE